MTAAVTAPSLDAARAAIRARMAALERSQMALAAGAGLSQGNISDFLSGKQADIGADTLARIAAALDTTVGELLGEANGVRPDAGPLQMIPLDRIGPSRFNPRVSARSDGIAGLAASIAASQGPIQPLLVAPAAPGLLAPHIAGADFVLCAGERRWTACVLLAARGDWPEDAAVPCLVRGPVDAETLLGLALTENVQREDLTPIEEATAFRTMTGEYGWSTNRIAEMTGRTQRWVQQRLALLGLGPAGRAALADGVVGPAAARHLPRLGDEGLEQAVVDQIRAGALPASEDAVRARVNQLVSKPAAERKPIVDADWPDDPDAEAFVGDAGYTGPDAGPPPESPSPPAGEGRGEGEKSPPLLRASTERAVALDVSYRFTGLLWDDDPPPTADGMPRAVELWDPDTGIRATYRREE